MKAKFFLAAGLLATVFGFSQTTAIYPANVSDGFANTFVGYLAGDDNVNGENNVNVGNYAGRENTGGNYNVCVGNAAGQSSLADQNVYLGGNTAQHNELGGGNVIVGALAGRYSTGGSNVIIGSEAGHGTSTNNFSGESNVFIGFNAGKNMTTGEGNIFIGNAVGATQIPPDTNHTLCIDNQNIPNPLIYGEFDNNVIKFNAERVGIGFDTNSEFGDFPDNTLVNYDDYRLFVRGGILAEEIRIRSYVNWADYVFAEDYKLMPLNEVAMYIADNGHLPNMPSAEEVEKEGLELGNIVKLHQEKIEELTLHLIEQEKEMEALKKQVQLLLNKQ